MRVIAVLAVVIAAVAAVPSNPQRIVGGTLTTIDNYPSIVALLATSDWSTYWHTCGGSIINSKSVLTAAHCVLGDNVRRWRVRVGSTYANSGGVVHETQSVIIHPEFNFATAEYDAAILRVTYDIVLSNNARPGSYAGSTYNLADNEVVWAAGWGSHAEGPKSEQLQHVQIWSVNQAECIRRYATIHRAVTDSMLCAGWLDVGGRAQCGGDSGSPLFHNGVIVGVCSWGNRCGDAFLPAVNARVTSFTPWIQDNA